MSITLKPGITLTCKYSGEDFLLEFSLKPNHFALLFDDGSVCDESVEAILENSTLPCSHFGRTSHEYAC